MRARDNPFAVDRVHQVRFRLAGESWDDLLDRLAALAYRAAIVGPHGSGKTTLLEDLQPHLEARGFQVHTVTLRQGDRALPDPTLPATLGRRDLLLLDGADELKPRAWRALLRTTREAGGLLIATHRPGRLPTLLTTATTPELLDEILRHLLPPEARADLDPAALHAWHNGNLRDALRDLYDQWAERLE